MTDLHIFPDAGHGPPDASLVTAPGRETSQYTELRIWADTFDQLLENRKAIANRLRSDAVHPDIVADLMTNLDAQEKLVGKAMRKSFRRLFPEVAAWLKTPETTGVGEHLMARLLGTIGHPVIATPYHWEGEGSDRVLVADEPFERNVAKLWAYCGYGDPERKRRKGMTAADAAALGNPKAKSILFLLAVSCVTQKYREVTPYGDLYDATRERYATREDWTNGHQHNAALRIVSKEILKDLWVVSKAAMDGQLAKAA